MNVKVSNMCMIRDGESVLVQERTKNDWPGITFPGGKLENDESIYASCVREVKEETGLDVSKLMLKGIIHYELKDKQERWLIYLYETHSFSGEIEVSDKEDEVYWINYADLKTANLSTDLDVYLKVYEDDTINEAHAYWHKKTSSDFTFY
ncbi:MAG: 8-oxo-dGTP diphosphatase [Erysipelotrichia bacterium]|nr:8-oxo-dGTP diphosphatase [Erysipelotrichia bacterium]NCC54756.1 8-oxo-dGTP diphosphatase [Erysipelotrichia bacterium]